MFGFGTFVNPSNWRREDVLQNLVSLNVNYITLPRLQVSLGSSVSIVSGYGLEDRAIEVRSPAGAKRFFL
jgi:hypothetical protein